VTAPELADRRPDAPTPPDTGSRDDAPRARLRPADLYAALVMLAGALWVTGRGWLDADGRFLGRRANDQAFNEWMLAHAARAVTHLDNPFFTTLQNAPDGVNLVTNVGLLLPGLLLTPVTLLGGPALAYVVLITANLAATGFAWYWALSRHLVASRAAAVLGGVFCAFAPALISHSSGHPHITAQWLVPFIVWRVVLLARPGRRAVRDGLILGTLVVLQFFVSVEILLLLATACALLGAGYLALRWREARRALPGAIATLAVTAALVLAATAYPLWMMFLGPQSRVGHPGATDVLALKLGAFPAFATQSLAGGPEGVRGLTPNATEEAAFFGWPVLVVAVAATVWLRRALAVRLLAGLALVTAVLATGTTLTWGARRSDLPAPFALLEHVPPFDAMVVARFALITTAALGVLLALAADRLRDLPGPAGVRVAAGIALVAAVLPVLPLPLPAAGRPAVPSFVADGGWRSYVGPGRTLVPVPIDNQRPIRWAAAAGVEFAVPQGYFLGPTSPTDRTGRWGTPARPTSALLTQVGDGKRSGAVTAAEREQARVDVRHWRADAVVLGAHPREERLREALDGLFGPGRRVEDVWLWDVRSLTADIR
jgi:hypothetical protein